MYTLEFHSREVKRKSPRGNVAEEEDAADDDD
jgi:hypothetical protein